MSVTVSTVNDERPKTVQPEPIDTSSTDSTRKKRAKRMKKKKKKKRKKKAFPINPVSLETESTEEDNEAPNYRSHRSRKSITELPELKPSKSARKPSKSPTRKKKKKKMSKASSLIRVSPRFSTNEPNIPRAKTPNNLPKKRRKKIRTNSSTVYKFVQYDAYSSDSMNEISDKNTVSSDTDVSLIATPIETKQITVSLASLKKNDTVSAAERPPKLNHAQSLRQRPRSSRTRRSRIRAASVGHSDDDSDGNNNALLKRLKTENKELRKSRNILRKDHALLTKIERKLRHKLDIIVSRFKNATLDLIDIDHDDETDWGKLQKKGDIEGILDAVFTKFGRIADQWVDSEARWNHDCMRFNKLEDEWQEFAEQHFVCRNNANDDESESKAEEKQFEIDDMFEVLKEKWNDIEQDKDRLLDEMLVYKNKDTKQESAMKELNAEIANNYSKNIEELKAEIVSLCAEKEQLQKGQTELSTLQHKYYALEKQFEEQHARFTEYKTKTEQELHTNKEQISRYRDNEGQVKLVRDYIRDMESEKVRLLQNIERIKKDNKETLNTKQKEIESMKKENKILNERKEELMGLKMEHLAVTEKLGEVQSQIYGLQDEFRVVYKKKKKFENENVSLKAELNEVLNKLKELESAHEIYKPTNGGSQPGGDDGEHSGTQPMDLEYALKDDRLNQLQTENEFLIQELDCLIAERSRFKPCTNDKDYHRGDIKCIVVSPATYCVISGGKDDHSLRVWEPKRKHKKHEGDDDMMDVSEITFVPKQKAEIDGTILCVNMSEDGALLAAGASLKTTVNGYIVVWDMNNEGSVLCNVRSRCMLRFGKVNCVEFMKFDMEETEEKDSDHEDMNYLLFAGDTTGCILCWNLWADSEDRTHPIAIINGHNDIVYDLSISNNEWLFSVSQDQCLMHLNISGLDKYKKPEYNNIDYIFSKRLFKDDSKYALKSVVYNENSNELIFGSRKCNIFKLNTDNGSEDGNATKYFVSKYGLNSKDVDHICNLKIKDDLMIIQRSITNYVKVFNLHLNKLVKTYQIDDVKHGNSNRFKIYDSGITYDKRYLVLCVGIFSKENGNNNNSHVNRSAIKGFKIPKGSK